MRVSDEYIPPETYATIQRQVPEACVEVFLETDEGVLVARRTNEPVKGEWFWPGGRLFKGERLRDAAKRVARDELGIDVELHGHLGVYSHFWETSAVPGVETRHTVNVVFRARPATRPVEVTLDSQHDAHRYVSEPSADLHEYVNQYLVDGGYGTGESTAPA